MAVLSVQNQSLGLPFVFRSVPHLPAFQDFTEANPEIAREYTPEDASIVYHALFCENARISPLPKSCAPVSRQSITCSCGQGIFRRSAFDCDSCSVARFADVQKIMDDEAAKAKKKEQAKSKNDGDTKKARKLAEWEKKMKNWKYLVAGELPSEPPKYEEEHAQIDAWNMVNVASDDYTYKNLPYSPELDSDEIPF